uniref:Transient receptor potential cation channel subfamily V member 3-like n=1 Tax=Crassostrea virginica TaxID=6565 RepID=A0A8B8CGE5_CRAVI|nr:transient receptor potential cation channel subfamily V member 3-like [Crassostrea virginica]
MVKDLEDYADLRVISLTEIFKILKEIDDRLNRTFHLISDKSSKALDENSDEKPMDNSRNKPKEKSREKFREKSEEQTSKKRKESSSTKSNDPESATAKFIEILRNGNMDCIPNYLNSLFDNDMFKASHFTVLNCAVERTCNGETLLHIAFKFEKVIQFSRKLMKKCPKLLLKDRRDHYIAGFEGQTPLHVAIANGSLQTVERILRAGQKSKILAKLLSTTSKGHRFNNTALMGQLPLTVAALVWKNDRFKIMDTLLKRGAEIWWTNEHGDNVFHSLIKYADIYPDKMSHLQASFEYLWRKYSDPPETHLEDKQKNGNKAESSSKAKVDENISKIKPKYLLLWKNKSELTPLQLSAKLGVSPLFDFIVNVQYCLPNIKDGLFDIRKYDVTEFDRLIAYKENFENEKKITVLERLFDPKCTHKEAFQLLNQELIAFILYKKWMAYRIPLFIWMCLHFIFMTLFTAFTTLKAEVLFCSQMNQTICDIGDLFVPPLALSIIAIGNNLIFGVFYMVFFILCCKEIKDRCSNGPGNFHLIYHNLDYVVCLFVIAVGALTEIFLISLRIHLDFHLILVLICGWYFMLYFAPFSKNLVSFTHMIKKGFLEDFGPFGLVFLYLLVCFTGIMHILFLGTEERVDEFFTFQDSLLTMFNLGVGLNNIDVLNEARVPWLAYTVFVVFAILSFIHLFNAFIAVMSQTFSDVHVDKHSYLKFNKLRMIELFEDIILTKGLVQWFSFIDKAKHWKAMKTIDINENYGEKTEHKNENTVKGINSTGRVDIGKSMEYGHQIIEKRDRQKEIYQKRFYSIVHLLDDPSDDIDEREEKKNEPDSKLKSFYKMLTHGRNSKRLGKRKPQSADITYVKVDYTNRATQYPDKKAA